MVHYTSLEQATAAHRKWVVDQGHSTVEVEDTMQRIQQMIVGFEPPAKDLPAKGGQIYYDCWGDTLYYRQSWRIEQHTTARYLPGGSEEVKGWAKVGEHVATMRELPLCQFYYALAHADQALNVLTYAGQAYKGYILRTARKGIKITIPTSTPAQKMEKYFQVCRVVDEVGDILFTLEYTSDNWVDLIEVEYAGKKARLNPIPDVITWKL